MAPSFSHRLTAGLSSKSHKNLVQKCKDISLEHEPKNEQTCHLASTDKPEKDSEPNEYPMPGNKRPLYPALKDRDNNAMPANTVNALANFMRSRGSINRNVLAPTSQGIHKTTSKASKIKSTEAGVKIPLKAPHEPSMPNSKSSRKKAKKVILEMRRVPSKGAKESESRDTRMGHPVSLHYKAATESYARHIVETIPSLLANGYANIVGNLSAVAASSTTQLDELSSLHDTLFFPIAEVELEIKLNKGRPEEKTLYETIGTRLESFTHLFHESETKLKMLRKKWERTTTNIRELRIEDESPRTQATGNAYLKDKDDVDSRYQKKIEAAKSVFENKLQELLDKAARFEKASDDRRRQSNKQLLLLLQQEEEEQEGAVLDVE